MKEITSNLTSYSLGVSSSKQQEFHLKDLGAIGTSRVQITALSNERFAFRTINQENTQIKQRIIHALHLKLDNYVKVGSIEVSVNSIAKRFLMSENEAKNLLNEASKHSGSMDYLTMQLENRVRMLEKQGLISHFDSATKKEQKAIREYSEVFDQYCIDSESKELLTKNGERTGLNPSTMIKVLQEASTTMKKSALREEMENSGVTLKSGGDGQYIAKLDQGKQHIMANQMCVSYFIQTLSGEK